MTIREAYRLINNAEVEATHCGLAGRFACWLVYEGTKYIRDIWGRLTSPLRKLSQQGIRESVLNQQADLQQREDNRQYAVQKIQDLSRYSWVTVGLNRHERRAIASRLIHGAVPEPINGRAQKPRRKILGAARDFAKFQLKNSPFNEPAHRGHTNNPMYWRGIKQLAGVA